MFRTADFGMLKFSWKMREAPFGETDFWAVGLWLAVQETQTAVPAVGFLEFLLKKESVFEVFLSPAFTGVLLPKLALRPKTGLFFLPVGRGGFLPPGGDFGAGDTGWAAHVYCF